MRLSYGTNLGFLIIHDKTDCMDSKSKGYSSVGGKKGDEPAPLPFGHTWPLSTQGNSSCEG